MTNQDLIKIREEHGHTQESMARKLGVSTSTIQKWEASEDTNYHQPIPKLSAEGIKSIFRINREAA
jgi:DNA-binding XRE family transcriptional regulator